MCTWSVQRADIRREVDGVRPDPFVSTSDQARTAEKKKIETLEPVFMKDCTLNVASYPNRLEAKR